MNFEELVSYYTEIFLSRLGLFSIILKPFFVAAGIFLYKITKQKLMVLPSVVISILLLVNIYYFLPMYIYSYVANHNIDECKGLLEFAYKIAIPKDWKYQLLGYNSFIADMRLNFGAYMNEDEEKKLIDTVLYYGNKSCTEESGEECTHLYQMYAMLGKYDEAIYIYEHSPALRRGYNPEFLVCLYILKKEYVSAINALQYIKNKDTRQRYRAEIYRRQGKLNAALEVLTDIIENGKPNCHNYAFRAFVYDDLDRIDLAKKDLKKAKDLCGAYDNKSYENFIKYSKIEHFLDSSRELYGIKLEELN